MGNTKSGEEEEEEYYPQKETSSALNFVFYGTKPKNLSKNFY